MQGNHHHRLVHKRDILQLPRVESEFGIDYRKVVVGQRLKMMLDVGIYLNKMEENITTNQKLREFFERLELSFISLLCMGNEIYAIDLAGLVGEESDELL